MIYRLFTLLWLILSLPLWTACSTNNTPETFTPLPTIDTPVASSASTNSAATIPVLSETYIGDNTLVNATLTVNYPAGWAAQGSGTQLLLASGEPENIEADDNALVVQIMPIQGDMLENLAEVSAEALVTQAIQDTVGQTSEPITASINDQDVAYASAESDTNSTFVYAIRINQSVFVVLTAIKTQALTPDDEALMMAIAETIQYEAGEIPQSP